MTNPVYPQSIFPWNDREDEIDIVWANDPNSLAAEVGAIESTLGPMPQEMSNPPAGNPINFTTVSQLLDYLTAGYHLPVCELQSDGQQVPNRQGSGTHYGVYNSYSSAVYDPFGLWNGTDITAPVTAWYTIDSSQFWDWAQTGYAAAHLWVGAGWKATNKWQWDFTGNSQGGYWQAEGTTGRPGYTGIHWSGIVNQGQRISVISENGTATTPANTRNLQLSVSMQRLTPPDSQLLPASVTRPTTPNPPTQVSRYPAPTGLHVSNEGNGNILVQWNRLTSPTPVPTSYTVAVYYTTGGLASYTTSSAPDSSGQQELTVANLPTGKSYQVHVWANGGLVAPPHATANISI